MVWCLQRHVGEVEYLEGVVNETRLPCGTIFLFSEMYTCWITCDNAKSCRSASLSIPLLETSCLVSIVGRAIYGGIPVQWSFPSLRPCPDPNHDESVQQLFCSIIWVSVQMTTPMHFRIRKAHSSSVLGSGEFLPSNSHASVPCPSIDQYRLLFLSPCKHGRKQSMKHFPESLQASDKEPTNM